MVSSATVTTTTGAKFIPEEWSDQVLEAIEFAANLQKRVTRRFEAEMKVGNTFRMARRSNLSTQTKSSGLSSVINWEAITEGQQTITVSTVEYGAFLVEDVVLAQANSDVMGGYTEKIGYALARGREVTVAALMAGLSQFQGNLNQPLAYDDYLAAYGQIVASGVLDQSGPQMNDNISIFLSAQEWVNALKINEFINRQYNTAGDAIQRATVGTIFGAPVYVSNLLTSDSSGHDNAMFHKDIFGLIVQKEVKSRSSFIIENIADGVVGWNVYGAAELDYPPETPGGGTATDNRGTWLKGQ